MWDVTVAGACVPMRRCRGFYPVPRHAQDPISKEGPLTDTSTRQGGCHCGKVRFEVTTDLIPLVACNCSICSKHGLVLTFVPEAQFKLLSGAEDLQEYLFNKHAVRHQFCRTCGVEPFARGTAPGTQAPVVALNVRCLDGIDVASLAPKPFDGRSL
jgi:hypothetical protein